MRLLIYPPKPFPYMPHHFFHMSPVCAKQKVFSRAFFHMPFEHHVKPICLFDCAPQFLKDPLPLRFLFLADSGGNPAAPRVQFLLERVKRKNIYRSWQNTGNNRLSKRQFRSHMAVKQLRRHVSLVIQKTDGCRRQTQNFCAWKHRKQTGYAFAPFHSAATVELI